MPTVLLVRHGRTTANAAGLLAGWAPDVVLDEVGWQQARALAARLGDSGMPLARLVSSPLPRCRQTAEALVGAQAGIQVQTDERLGECHYGVWTGRALKELAAEPLWRVVQDQPSAAVFPDGPQYPGESLAAMSARAIAAVRDHDAQVAVAAGDRAVWVAVTHGDIVKAVLADALGVHLDQFQRIHVDPASVSVVSYTARRPFVVRVNDVGGSLAGLVPADPGPEAGDAAVGGGAGAGEPSGSAGEPSGHHPSGSDVTARKA